MKYAMCTIALRDWPLDKIFAMMRQSGYRRADIHARHLPETLSLEESDRVGALARSHGIEIASLASGVGDGLADSDAGKRRAAVQEVIHCIDQAHRLGATVIRAGLGDLKSAGDPRLAKCVVPAMEEILAHAEKRKVRVGVETHSGGPEETVEGCRKVCAAIPSKWFGLIYDPGNLFGLLQDYEKVLELLPDRIVHVHMKDGIPAKYNDNYAPQRLSCTAFGKGELDIPFILKRLRENGYDGLVSVEYEAWHPEYPLPPVDPGLKDSLEYLERICPG